MKYIRPPEFKSVKEFTEYYRQVEQNITELLTKDSGTATSKELNTQLKTALQAAVSYLSGVNREYTKTELPHAFEEGRKGVPKSPAMSMKEAAAILKKQGYRYAGNAFSRDTYIELQSAVKSAGNGFLSRVNKTIEDLRKEGKDSVYNVQEAVKKDLEENGLLTVKYANGAKQPLSAYAAMAARSARIESVNLGAIGRALQEGTNYVKMTTMPQCCKYCGAYQGKVYCISGKDKRFPALFKTVLKSGYALPHPNCRHEFIPWFFETEAPEDVEKAIKDSRIRYNADGSLKDVRYQKDIEGYAAWQAGNRQLNAELLEYQKMQAYYKGREDIPYKSLASFRRARRADELSPAYKAWRNRKKDENTLNRWKEVKNFKNAPQTLEELQQIKYNKNTEAWERLKRERTTIAKIDDKPWTDTFREKAINAYYDFREKGIEITDHGVARFLQRGFSVDEIAEIDGKSFNYTQDDGKFIKYHNGVAVVYTSDKKEVVSMIRKTQPKGEWHEIKN